jgi:hypothetical protein
MHAFWLFLHFVGLVMGAGPGMANMVIARRAESAAPEGAAALRAVPPVLVNISTAGVVLLWISGLVLLTEAGGPSGVPTEFWIKIAFVVILTLIVIAMQVTLAQIRGGNRAAAGRMKALGPAAGACALLAVLFAAIAFG